MKRQFDFLPLLSETPENGYSITEESLPDSAELFLSLIKNASNAVEQELQECQTLVEQQVHNIGTMCETSIYRSVSSSLHPIPSFFIV